MDVEDKLIFNLDIERIKKELNPRDQVIFDMWIKGYTLQQTANVVGPRFNKRTPNNPLTCRAIGARLHKILERIRKKEIL